MKKVTGILRGRHCVFDLKAHLVFIPKYRKKVFTSRVLLRFERVFCDVCKRFEAKLEEFNGEADHAHLLVSYPPKVSLSKLVNSLKGVSARPIKKENYAEIASNLWGKHLWSPSYYAASGSSGKFFHHNHHWRQKL